MAGFLTAAQLAAIQTTVNASLPWTVRIWRNTPTRETGGAMVDNWAVSSAAACDVEGLQSPDEEALVNGQLQAVNLYLINLPAGTDIVNADRVEVLKVPYASYDGTGSGVYYEVRNRVRDWTDEALIQVAAKRSE